MSSSLCNPCFCFGFGGLQQEDDQKSPVPAQPTQEQEACNSQATAKGLG